MSAAKPLDMWARLERYGAQNQGGALTPRQARRLRKKTDRAGRALIADAFRNERSR
jgi:hypothetical protein